MYKETEVNLRCGKSKLSKVGLKESGKNFLKSLKLETLINSSIYRYLIWREMIGNQRLVKTRVCWIFHVVDIVDGRFRVGECNNVQSKVIFWGLVVSDCPFSRAILPLTELRLVNPANTISASKTPSKVVSEQQQQQQKQQQQQR